MRTTRKLRGTLVIASAACALAACGDASAPRVHLGDYQYTIAYQGKQTVLTGHDAAFYRYNYAPGTPTDTAMYLFVGDSMSFFQFESPPSYFPAPGTDSVHTFDMQGSTWLTVEAGNAALSQAQLLGEPNTVTFEAATPDSVTGTFVLKFLIVDTATVTGRFYAGPTSAFRSTDFATP